MKRRLVELRLSLQRWLLKTFELECQKHILGKVTYNEAGDAYSECRICDEEMTLVGKTLGEVDKMSIGVVGKLLPKGTSLEDVAMSANTRSGLVKSSEDNSS